MAFEYDVKSSHLLSICESQRLSSIFQNWKSTRYKSNNISKWTLSLSLYILFYGLLQKIPAGCPKKKQNMSIKRGASEQENIWQASLVLSSCFLPSYCESITVEAASLSSPYVDFGVQVWYCLSVRDSPSEYCVHKSCNRRDQFHRIVRKLSEFSVCLCVHLLTAIQDPSTYPRWPSLVHRKTSSRCNHRTFSGITQDCTSWFLGIISHLTIFLFQDYLFIYLSNIYATIYIEYG